jgi:exopolysaccharide biosynthesis polyprenyl glycosylphosphotransferase
MSPPDVNEQRRSEEVAQTVVDCGTPAAGGIPEGIPSPPVLKRDALYRRGLAVADLVAAAAALCLSVVVLGGETPALGALLALPMIVLLSKLVGLYDRDERVLRKTTLEEVPAVFSVATLAAFGVWLLDGLAVQGPLGRAEVMGLWGSLFAFMLLGRAATRSVVRSFAPEERCLILGNEKTARELSRKFEVSFSLSATVVGRVPLKPEPDSGRNERNVGPHLVPPAPPILGSIDTLGLVLAEHDVDRVIVAPNGSVAEDTLDAIRVVRSLGVRVSVLPRMLEVVGSSVEFDDVDGLTLLGLHGSRLSRSSAAVKRAMDVLVAGTAVVLLLPLLVALAAAIKLSSPGPVFFRQKRIGRNGHEFDVLKFRSMRLGADAEKEKLMSLNETEGLFKIANDPRVTTVGRYIRRFSLDELPQILNVLRGEMSLVGPRPLVPEDDAKVEGWQRARLAVVPGMTGPWQIVGSTRVPLQEMVKIDYLYGANWSLWTDVKILLRTIAYVAGARSA